MAFSRVLVRNKTRLPKRDRFLLDASKENIYCMIKKRPRQDQRHLGYLLQAQGRQGDIVHRTRTDGAVLCGSQNHSGTFASEKIPGAFQASFVVTAQPVTDPRGTVYQDAGSLIRGHVKHLHHADGDHPSPNLESFCTSFRVLPIWCRSCLHEMRSDLQTFQLVMVSAQKFFRVSIY